MTARDAISGGIGGGDGGGISGGGAHVRVDGGGFGSGARGEGASSADSGGSVSRGLLARVVSAAEALHAARGGGGNGVGEAALASAASEAWQYLTTERGLSASVLREYGVGVALHKFVDESGAWSEHACVVFPWLDMDPPSQAVGGQDAPAVHARRLKLRSLREKGKQAMLPAGGEWGLFGLHSVPASADSVVLTEGEFDAMAVRQATGAFAVSLPNGCRSLPVQVLPYLERFKTIYLWMDDDVSGREGASKFATKLGLGRTLIVQTSVCGADAKDANDALRRGYDLRACLAAAAPVKHDQILSFADLSHEVFREVLDAGAVSGTPFRWLPSLQKMLKGHRSGELSVYTGPTGAGKTTLLSQLSLDLADQGMPTLWGSFEVKNVRLLKKMLTQASGERDLVCVLVRVSCTMFSGPRPSSAARCAIGSSCCEIRGATNVFHEVRAGVFVCGKWGRAVQLIIVTSA